ncbi:ParB N-terminal domain-containing protein [Prosthecochloris sp.]|uniref:ParB N-terminal domain-containing protein n=1 Tax=Prosthecochloris sp. TaxID=290513 RepID=UPI0025F234C4|nr:ParB N-terminal domain-containing protein [Prosthecochloris sp.]
MRLTELKLNLDNPRVIDEDKLERLCRSLKDFPQMMELRPIIVDDQSMIMGGNMRYKALQKLGYDEIPDLWVKRAEELTAEQKREFIIKDNVGFGEWDLDALVSWDQEELLDWGLNLSEFTEEEIEFDKSGVDGEYTKKIQAPIYEPKNEKPAVSELCDTGKYIELIEEIKATEVDEETKRFLILAAQRHNVFDYRKIADFYAHSDTTIQNLMERSALVIIDFEKAIENGYVKLSEELEDIFLEDYCDDEE